MAFMIAGESELDLSVAHKILSHFGYEVYGSFNKGGHAKLDANLPGYANASQQCPWLVLRDMDAAECPVSLADQLIPNRHNYQNLLFRVVVREIESWILADRAVFANFLGISQVHIPAQPESVEKPKQTLMALAAHSRHRRLREGLIPREGSGARVGPEYNAILQKFVTSHWDAVRASDRADSLARLMRHIERWTEANS
ncbi:hypothetical protein [Altererythrobacter sp. C41]|uniref:hypothetical protein n=1 Tax=Altererythrobacter sp. C41 TaxID=2806021 RepID=UPI001932CB0C|nr:hypothetical protein [Altererythrobacter sp. C41]MBM0169428.1 hypothetical protein [Altererythrobacter sp. C41]